MLSQFSYPVICSAFFNKTISFYEDYFNFSPVLEMEGYAVLKRADCQNSYLAVIDSLHDGIPQRFRRSVQGLILSFPVEDVADAYRKLYLEGLNILGEPDVVLCGRRHFLVEDPNGILISVAENVALEDILDPDNIKELYRVA